MKICYEQPLSLGTLPAGLLDNVEEEIHISSLCGNVQDSYAEEAFKQIEEFALPVLGNLDGRCAYDSADLEPGQRHRDNSWHTDAAGVVVVNCMPTEFLVGTFKLTREIKRAIGNQGPKDPFFYSRVASLFDTYEEARLNDLGLSVWQPQPNEVVYKNDKIPHRSRINTTGVTLKRVFMFAGLHAKS